mgnify:CR=1 FL=1
MQVDEYMTIETYATVHHIVSNVRGELRGEFLKYHAALLDADYWRRLKAAHAAEEHLEIVPYQRRQISHILAAP